MDDAADLDVERELRGYLDCGLLSRGFIRIRCPDCGFERLVAFSCKASIWAVRSISVHFHTLMPDGVFAIA